MPLVLGRRGEADVRVDRNDGQTARLPRGEVDLVELVRGAERCAAHLRAADRLLLVEQRRAVPDLDQHADAPGDEVRAAGEPALIRRRRHPDVLREPVGVLELDVVRAVLEAHQVARRVLRAARRRRAAEAELRPAHHDAATAEARQVAHRVERDLRVVGAGLDAEVAAALRRVERVLGERRQLLQRGGALALEAEAALLEQRRADAERDREPRRRQPDRLARVVGRRVRVVVGRARRQSGGHQRRRLRPRPQQVGEILARVGDDVERREVQPILSGRGDARLVRPVERDRVAGRRRVAVVGEPLDAEAAERERRTARAGTDQQLATAEARPVHLTRRSWSSSRPGRPTR